MRLAILSDIHGNFHALQAVVADMDDSASLWLARLPMGSHMPRAIRLESDLRVDKPGSVGLPA